MHHHTGRQPTICASFRRYIVGNFGLETAASALRLARNLAGEGLLADVLDETLRRLDEAHQIAGRAKQIMLHQWRSADAQGRAA